MIYGIGIDIVRNERIRAAVERWGRRFLDRVFTDAELAHCLKRKTPYASLAVRFAAKEALIKAVGSKKGSSFRDIEVLNSASGKPYINLSGNLKDFFSDENLREAHVSLSHEQEYSVAAVVVEK